MPESRPLAVSCLLPLLAALPLVAQTPASPAPPTSGDRPLTELPHTPSLDPAAMDRSVDPCVDFYAYSCGGWQKANPIPPDQSSWSVYGKLYVENQRLLWGLLQQAAEPRPDRSPEEQKIGDEFAACMDEAAIDRAGLEPIAGDLAAIRDLTGKREIPALLARLHLDGADRTLFRFGSDQDPEDSTRVIAFARAAGLGLPDRDYYLKDDGKSKETRGRYLGHVAQMFELLGDAPTDAAFEAATVLRLETTLAGASLTRVERRDPHALLHKMTPEALGALMPSFDWKTYLAAIGVPGVEVVNVTQPAFFKAVEGAFEREPLTVWQSYLRWHLARATARDLARPFDNAAFDFYGRYLRGAEEQPPRWRRCVQRVDRDLGEALGKVYVQRTFRPEIRSKAEEMTRQIETVMGERIRALGWMDEATKKQALAKLASVHNKVGYPDRWRDYSGLEIRRDDFLGDLRRAHRFEMRRQLDKIGKPVDRGEWGMTPPTVNAYYNPSMNDVNFPAGVLQPPLFDLSLDDAPNYGDTGSTIGHELTHGFDDQGRQYDAQGNLRDWWTPEDAAAFKARAQCLVDQYGGYTVVDDLKQNSRLTLGEDIADLGGTILAYEAWKKEVTGRKLEPADGLTPEQRFFVGFAQWACSSQRPQMLRLSALTNEHSIPRYRINGVVVNMPEFARAFGCRAGQPMVKTPAELCRIW